MSLYSGPGRRRVLPPLVFGVGVLWHLLRHGRRYDVVHMASFPYFSLLAAAAARRAGRYRLVVDWFEVWTRAYWRDYLGRLGGYVGWLIQRLCARMPQHAFCFSRLHASRLRDEGFAGDVTILAGVYDGPLDARPVYEPEPLVVFAGRHIPEKRVPAIVPAIARRPRSRAQHPRARSWATGLTGRRCWRWSRSSASTDAVEVPGFVATETVEERLSAALCMVLPVAAGGLWARRNRGRRARHPERGGSGSGQRGGRARGGRRQRRDRPVGLARRTWRPRSSAFSEGGFQLRHSTADWFAANAPRLSRRGARSRL